MHVSLSSELFIGGSFPSRVQVYIEVLDENDNTPLTELPVYYPSVAENSPAGVSVLQIRAFDRDVSPQQFVFTISSGNPEGYFLINSTTGKFPDRVLQPASRRAARSIASGGEIIPASRQDRYDGSLATPGSRVMSSISFGREF